jgi:hypothetical protein
MLTRRLVTATVGLLLAACYGSSPSAGERTLPFARRGLHEIAEPQEVADFQDLELTLKSVRQSSSSTFLEAVGLHSGTPVALRIVIPAGTTRDSVVRLESLGQQSDAFLSSLGELYHSPVATTMRRSASFDFIPLKGTPATLANGELKLKLFCHEQRGDQYCELYLNTNLPAGTVEIAEKDPGYRKPLLAWLGSP